MQNIQIFCCYLLYQQNLCSSVILRQIGISLEECIWICYKLAFFNKTRKSVTSKKLGSCNFLQSTNVINIGKYAILPLFIGYETFSRAQNVAANCNLNDSNNFLPGFLYRTNLDLYNILKIPRYFRRSLLLLICLSSCWNSSFRFNKLWACSFILIGWSV